MNLRQIIKSKKNYWLLTWVAGGIFYLLARKSIFAAEYIFARGIFRGYANVMSFITNLCPLSLMEGIAAVLIVAGIPALIVFFILRLVKSIRKKEKGAVSAFLLLCIRNVLIAGGIVFLWFMIGCGTNYYRYEFAHFSGLEIRKSTTQELYELTAELAVRTSEARRDTGTPESEVFVSGRSDRELLKTVRDAMNELGKSYEVLGGFTPVPKPVIGSKNMSEFNITGVYSPFTVEANVNVDIPDYSCGVTAAHELTHLKGFMREDEANFVGYLVCISSDDAELRYSGLMLALIHAGNQLYAADKQLYSEVYSLYSEGVKRDLAANNEYWKQYEDTVYSEAGEKMNDTYLKANNQTDGTRSYGRMVDLLLAEYRKNHGIEQEAE